MMGILSGLFGSRIITDTSKGDLGGHSNDRNEMMNMAQIKSIPISDLTKTVTMNVSIIGYRGFKIKLYIGVFLIRLGIWIIGINGDVESVEWDSDDRTVKDGGQEKPPDR